MDIEKRRLTRIDPILPFDDLQFERLIAKWNGHSNNELTGTLSACADIGVSTLMRQLQVAFLTFKGRRSRKSAHMRVERVLSTRSDEYDPSLGEKGAAAMS